MSEQYVLDTSALMQAYVQDNYTDQAKVLLAQLLNDEPPELHILDIALAEAANVFWKRAYLHKRLSLDAARKALLNLRGLPLNVHESSPLLIDGLTLSVEQGLAVYDTLVISLAQKLNLPLITTDSKQEQIAKKAGISIKLLTDFAPTE